MPNTWSFDWDSMRFVCNGELVDSVIVTRAKNGRLRYTLKDTGHLIASGVTPVQFATRWWFINPATQWRED